MRAYPPLIIRKKRCYKCVITGVDRRARCWRRAGPRGQDERMGPAGASVRAASRDTELMMIIIIIMRDVMLLSDLPATHTHGLHRSRTTFLMYGRTWSGPYGTGLRDGLPSSTPLSPLQSAATVARVYTHARVIPTCTGCRASYVIVFNFFFSEWNQKRNFDKTRRETGYFFFYDKLKFYIRAVPTSTTDNQ